jgi:ribosomal protein S28E/S33
MNITITAAITALVALVLSASTSEAANSVEEQTNWKDTYTVNTTAPHLQISNIWGGVNVRTGKNGQISVSAVELRSAPDQERFDRSFESIRLDVKADANGVSLLVGDPNERWHRLNECRGCRLDIQFEILVPPGATVDVGTVMDGRVDIEGVTGSVSASNVNGPVRVGDIQECTSIESVNGKVDVGFATSPLSDCSIETINGDITLDVPEGTGMDIKLDLFNGDLSSQLTAGPLELPAIIEHTMENGHEQYRIQKFSGLRIGAGGPTYSISSMNGDVRIQKQP